MVGKKTKGKSLSSGSVSIRNGSSKRQVLGPDFKRIRNHVENVGWAKRRNAMSDAEKLVHSNMHEQALGRPDEDSGGFPMLADDEEEIEDTARIRGILSGKEVLDISHEGEEVGKLISVLRTDIASDLREARRRMAKKDTRTRKDRVNKRGLAFSLQMEQMSETFGYWEASRGDDGLNNLEVEPAAGTVEKNMKVRVVDMFSTYDSVVHVYSSDPYTACAYVRSGLIPCSPFNPTMAMTARTVEFYRRCRLRSPRFSIQAFCGTLSDLHGVPYKKHLSQQVVICHDLYISLCDSIDRRVQKALLRDSPNWRLANACGPCLYTIEDEIPMKISVLLTMDGNNSLSRVKVIERVAEPVAGESAPPGVRNESRDSRNGRGDYIIDREDVDKWARDTFANQWESGGDPEVSECESRWHNMVNDMTSRMWAVYDETGAFVAVCRHGMTMLILDMVESGELAKYPLALIARLIEVLKHCNMYIGYDCGCKFKKTCARSALGPLAKERNLCFCTGLFHGHAHNRLCQLLNLGTYIEGMGLENLEQCERTFSKSNALAPVIRHSSVFHRHQIIRTYFQHMDEIETYQSLSVFLFNNMKHALEVLATRPTLIEEMRGLQVEHSKEFYSWLAEERHYLSNITKEPEEESLKIEYYKALVKLEGMQEAKDKVLETDFAPYNPYQQEKTLAIERERRHAIEKAAACLDTVEHLETKLGIAVRWGKGSAERQEQAKLSVTRDYRLALDKLEALVVSRIFELTKMNMSQTGYKLRKHIAKALQVRSKAIKTALKRFNEAGAKLTPPRETLDWEDVVAYAFLAEFDLLRDTRQDVRQKKWATPRAWRALDMFFKILRAKEEVDRCTNETNRLLTKMRDDELYLRAAYRFHQSTNADIAYQIRKRYWFQKAMNDEHRKRIARIANLRGFTGKLEAGNRLGPREGFNLEAFDVAAPVSTPVSSPAEPIAGPGDDAGPAAAMDVDASPAPPAASGSSTDTPAQMSVDAPPVPTAHSPTPVDEEPPQFTSCVDSVADEDDYDHDVDGEFEWEEEEEALRDTITIMELSDDLGSVTLQE